MIIISKTSNGKIFKCSKCNAIHIEFKNLNFNLNEIEFKRFAHYIQKLDGEEWEAKNKHSLFSKKIFLPVGSGYFNAIFNNDEFNEFKRLLSCKKECQSDWEIMNLRKLKFNTVLN